jgi:D-tyrosyl-tRNA(Tyr) deacylase
VKTVVQRVSRAEVRVDGEIVGQIGRGVLALVAVERGDTLADALTTARKLASLRMFAGDKPMDRTLAEVGGAALVISQFTLAGSVRKGRRPSFDQAEDPDKAEPLYLAVVDELRAGGIETATGKFAASMSGDLADLHSSRGSALVKLQRYQIMEPLGAGGQAHTYRAIDRETGDEVAIKVLSLQGANEWKGYELFEREAKVLAGLRHPGIPRYRDYFASEESGDYFLVMDLVPGRSLADALADKLTPTAARLDEAGLRRIMLGVLDILEYLHSRTPPVIHRDLKPANILLDRDGGVHVVDFGAVRVLGQQGGTGGATMVGTFGYMAPEQLHGEAGPGADLYALGATIAALATGQPADELPHEGLAIELDALPLPERLRPVLRALLEPDPRRRVSNVAQVRALLDGHTSATRPTEASESSTALAIPNYVHELARTPKPFSILIWLVSLFGAAVLAVIEFAILPIVYLILRAAADNQADKGKALDDDKAGITSLREFRQTASRQRQLVSHLIRSTSPLRDEPPALPPGRADDR